MRHFPLLLRLLFARRTLYVAAWILAIGIAVGRLVNAYYCFAEWRAPGDPERRVDGNYGHLTIDFGGQWLMGRILATGRGRELYSRPRQWAVAEQAFPRECEAPRASVHDPESLIQNFMGQDDPRWRNLAGAVAAIAGAANPFQIAATAVVSQPDWSAERLDELSHPCGPDGVGGPLYPPIHAFLMLPFALGDHPQAAYYAMQYVQTLLCLVAGLGVSLLSRGRFWWPLAGSLILLFPGSRGAIDLGQNSAFSLTLLIWGWVCCARGRPAAGGIIWGCLAYKPVWAVTFLLFLLVVRQWRMALIMALTGAALALSTLPVVGVQSWLHWLTIGQDAARLYNVDANWVPLSRDLLGIPRRLLIDFDLSRDQRENPRALLASWVLWAFVLEVSLRVYSLAGKDRLPFTGPLPALLILAAWMCTFHFMYYDAMISAFGACVLLADPRPFFKAHALNRERVIEQVVCLPSGTATKRSLWLVNSLVLSVVVMMIIQENIAEPLKFEATIVAQSATSQRKLSDGTTEPAPRIVVGSGDRYPMSTLLVGILWAWCCVAVLSGRWPCGGRDGPKKNEMQVTTAG